MKETKATQQINKIVSLEGICLPLTTCFDAHEDLNLVGLSANIRRYNHSGILGYVVLGSTGERANLNEEEYLRVVETARAQTPSSMTFIVGAGQQSTRGTINEVRAAANAGADAILVLTPYFYRSAITQEALVTYYNIVADSSSIPVLLYSMPALTGIKIQPETIARLAQHPNIIGVKDSSNDIEGFQQTVELCPEDFAVLTGNGTVLFDALKSGATGGILAVGCAVPEVCVEIFRLFQQGEMERAQQLQSKLTPFAAAVTTRFGIGGLKAALDRSGYVGGVVRRPLAAPNEEQCAEIFELLNEVACNHAQLTESNR
ncbi:MAG TPA: dihydrodipicolinate synthase family protein [Pyrinomonadaceae bacterium]